MDVAAARKILGALANGVNPATGAAFPADSAYQQPDVVRALFYAHRAIAFHLHHPSRAPSGENPNDRYLAETLSTRAVRCEVGLDAHVKSSSPRAASR